MEIVIYNSAGEKVRSIEDAIVSNLLSGIAVVDAGGNTTTVFNPSAGSAEIRLYGISRPGTGLDYTSYYWDGANQQGQPLTGGIYYISIKITDEYGATQTNTLEVSIVRGDKHIRLSIYNSAGETVRHFEVEPQPDEIVSLSVADVSRAGHSGQGVSIEYAPGKFINWDGTGTNGVLVAGGVYEIKLEQQFEDGHRTMLSKSITILIERKMALAEDLKAAPNPILPGGSSGERVEFSWASPYSGRMEIKIYNNAGELIRELNAGLAEGSIRWDLRTAGGHLVSSGVYPVIAIAVKDTGEKEKRVIKSVVIRRGSNNNY